MAVSIVDRQKAEALIEEQLIRSIAQGEVQDSTFMRLARRLPNMTSKQTRIPVLDMLPMAYWVNGDTGVKQTTETEWDNVYLTAAELAVIVPFPEAVLDDASFDIMGEIQPRILEAFWKKVDEATIFGIDRPPEWQSDIVTLARNAGNNVAVGSSPDYYDLLMGEGGVIAKVEEDGFMSNGAIAAMAMRSKLRGIRTTEGALLFSSSMQGATPYALDGEPMYFPRNGSFDTSRAQLVLGDWRQAVYAIRQDVTTKILTEGVIQDPSTREIVYNLAQQDMIAIRIVFRMGWATPNPISAFNADRTGCAWAYLEPRTPATTYATTVTVETNDEIPEPIAGAMVDIGGSRIKANASGEAEYRLSNGTYPVKVKASGYDHDTVRGYDGLWFQTHAPLGGERTLMAPKVTINLRSSSEILAKRGLNQGRRVQQFFGNEIARVSDSYVPLRQGPLKNTVQVLKNGAEILYPQPYAAAQWYSKRSPGSSTGPLRGPRWAMRMWDAHGEQIKEGAAKVAGGKAE